MGRDGIVSVASVIAALVATLTIAADASVPIDHWFCSLFQSTPDLVLLLLLVAGVAENPSLRLGPESPGNQRYRFEALPLEQLEALGLALLDFQSLADLAAAHIRSE
jgi:hypothetical protein